MYVQPQPMTLNNFSNDWKDLKTLKTFEKLLEWSEIANKFSKLLIVQGGYAVDLSYGKLTRNHDDLDLIVKEEDLNWFKERLIVDVYKIKVHEDHNPDLSFCAYKFNFILEDSVCLDLEGINIDKQVWDRNDGEKFVWPTIPGKLYQVVTVEGISLKYLSPELVYEFKKKQQDAGWDKREKEDHDFKILKLSLPKNYKG